MYALNFNTCHLHVHHNPVTDNEMKKPYLSIAIAINVNTLADMEQGEMNKQNLQKTAPSHQSWYRRKKNVQGILRIEIKKSATARFTMK